MSFGIKTNHEKSFWASDGIANKFAAVESTKNTTHPFFGTLGRYFKVTSCDVAIIRPVYDVACDVVWRCETLFTRQKALRLLNASREIGCTSVVT